jgi:Domain of unknown function (DUF397)
MENMNWRKSTYSGANGGNCVEVGTTRNMILVRDTKDAEGPRLSVGTAAWKAFTDQLKKLRAEHPPPWALASRAGGVPRAVVPFDDDDRDAAVTEERGRRAAGQASSYYDNGMPARHR